jgi:hypothetical protein
MEYPSKWKLFPDAVIGAMAMGRLSSDEARSFVCQALNDGADFRCKLRRHTNGLATSRSTLYRAGGR